MVGGCVNEGCHESFYSIPVKHGPVVEGGCLPCHTPIAGKHQFEEMPDYPYLCRSCHRPFPKEKLKHPDAGEYCKACHNPHGGNERFFLVEGSVKQQCLSCHADRVGGQPQHAPVARGSCLSCHELHHAEAKPLLRLSRGKLCIRCHQDKAKGIRESVSVHAPITEDCTLCHEPHAGGHGQHRIKADLLDLCEQCHADMLKYAKTAKVPHNAVIEGEHCINCHDPHFAGGRHLLKAPTRTLCLRCHDRAYQLPDGYVLQDVKTQLNESRYVHGPARQGSCNPCHNPHGSDYPRLLNFDFPCSFYADFEESRYDLCFRCHDRRMILEPETEITRFRNGRQNLHFLHVNREKGRTCRACHHEHATDNAFRIRESVPYGSWQMPLTFRKKGDGGSCESACHAAHAYNRIAPVRNLATPVREEIPGDVKAKGE